jgi:hypothetical protein
VKSEFLTPLEIQLITPWANEGRGEWEFLSDLKYYSELLQQEVVVFKGFKFDGASVPRIPLVYSLYGGKYFRSAGIHDMFCRFGAIPRNIADKVFLEAMRVENEEELQATGNDPERRANLEGQALTMYAAVRAGSLI